jgi:hypothetical protein
VFFPTSFFVIQEYISWKISTSPPGVGKYRSMLRGGRGKFVNGKENSVKCERIRIT